MKITIDIPGIMITGLDMSNQNAASIDSLLYQVSILANKDVVLRSESDFQVISRHLPRDEKEDLWNKFLSAEEILDRPAFWDVSPPMLEVLVALAFITLGVAAWLS